MRHECPRYRVAPDRPGPGRRLPGSGLLAAALLLSLAGCQRAADVTQVAARVNDADVTVHQVNFALQQQGEALRPDQADAAGRRMLESLIDQELAVQKSLELKLDREPQVVQALEAARREVLARAWRERVSQAGARPTADEVQRFYAGTPALFAQRRVYTLHELQVDVPAERLAGVKQHLAGASGADAFTRWLAEEGLRVASSDSVTPAEQLPMGLVEPFARLQAGEATVVSDGPPLRVVFVTEVRTAPLSLERAAPAIEQYLATQARRRAIDEQLKALRGTAQIRYHGKFVGEPADGAGVAGRWPAASAPPTVQLPLPEGPAEPVKLKLPDAAPAPVAAGSAIDPNLAKKGMGLK